MNSFDFDSSAGLVKKKCSNQSTFKSQLLLYLCYDIELGLYKKLLLELREVGRRVHVTLY